MLERRINQKIFAKEVRLVNVDGQQLGIMDLSKALLVAEDEGLDLVEIAPSAKPPVCRIMDHSKYRYQQQRLERQARRNQHQIKVRDLRLRPTIAEHDRLVKEKTAARMLAKGDHVRLAVRMRGRENDHPQIAIDLVETIAEALRGEAEIIRGASRSGREVTMILAPSDSNNLPPEDNS